MFRPDSLLPIAIRYHAAFFLAGLMLIASTLRANGQEAQVFAGSAGKASVVMELEGQGEDVRGRYFYRRYRQDIGLAGGWSGETLTLKARTTGDSMILRRNGNGLAGSLSTGTGRKVKVSLAPAIDQGTGLPGATLPVSGMSPYEQAQLAGLAFVPGKTRQAGSRTLRDWREPVSGIEMFRIESGYPAPVLDKINAAIERRHWEQVSQWFSCEGYGDEPGMDISEARSPYLGDGFVSYAWFASYSCAGTAHPDFGTQGYTFDAQTGRELSLEDLLYFGPQPLPAADTPELYTYRSETFAPRVVALLGQLYPQEFSLTQGDEDECDYSDPSAWDFPSWYLTPQGLYLGSYFPRAMRPCDEPDWAIIPWKYLTYRKAETLSSSTPEPQPDALHFGQLAFRHQDIAMLSQGFDDNGFPVLDIALQPEPAKRLEAETIRLLDTDVTFALGTTTLLSARLVEPLANGKMRISGRYSLAETQDMAGRIICAMHLSAGQYSPATLAIKLPCKTDNRQAGVQ